AYAQDFNNEFGMDPNSLASWQKLCRAIGISSIPDNLDACRRLVRRSHVNIYNLVDNRLLGKPLKRFDSVEDLASYCAGQDKYFPASHLKAGGLLRSLLR
ncbi:hypothetical protein PUNSTDRAFT_35133, partial [Punctularia strigosozonata HHB-11173 SS5]|uniref:uncharacterized protein n=1 Tax=Punctularia strigosozonata (strain HHB-11173) TaxID=741275 RepID=UPI0004416C4A